MPFYVKCYKAGCETPYFCIPKPNTRTMIAYADNPDPHAAGANGESLSGQGPGRGNQPTASIQTQYRELTQTYTEKLQAEIEANGFDNVEALLQEFYKSKKKEGIGEEALTKTLHRLIEIGDTNYDDYLVVYCDSGHKNYVPFKN